ncbi:MAG TPA: GNAT family N-acetyltransferase [Candidatus Paceibacterota bacterium]
MENISGGKILKNLKRMINQVFTLLNKLIEEYLNMDLELRRVTSEDWMAYRDFRLSALQSKDAKAFGGSYEKESIRSHEEWRIRLEDNGERFFYGCFYKNEIVSAAGVYFDNKGKDKWSNNWIIVGVYTRPEFRNRGFSYKTMEAVLGKLKSDGVKKVILMVNTKQESAINLYTKLGFKNVELIKDHPMGDGQTHDEFVMEKILAE